MNNASSSFLTNFSATFLQAGYCTHPEAIVVQGGQWRSRPFPAMVALIHHPELGHLLFDTGYSTHFHEQTRPWPNRLYALVTPVCFHHGETVLEQIHEMGLSASDIQHVFISHFHADHIAGLRDFPQATLLTGQAAIQSVTNIKNGWRALKKGLLPGLLPDDFKKRVQPLESCSSYPTVTLNELSRFNSVVSLTSDQRVLAVSLPGHAAGQYGLLLRFHLDTLDHADNVFFIGDACWLSENYQQLKRPHPITRFFHHNYSEYIETIQHIHQLHQLCPNLRIIPTHCDSTIQQLRGSTHGISL